MCRSRGRNNAVLTSNKTAGCVQTCSNSCKSSRRASQLAPEDPGMIPLLEVFPLSYPSTLRLGQLRCAGYRRRDVSGTFEMLPSSLTAAVYKALIEMTHALPSERKMPLPAPQTGRWSITIMQMLPSAMTAPYSTVESVYDANAAPEPLSRQTHYSRSCRPYAYK